MKTRLILLSTIIIVFVVAIVLPAQQNEVRAGQADEGKKERQRRSIET